MRTLLLSALFLSIVACGGSTEPNAGDPSILVTNDLPASWVYVNWKDGQGIVGRDSVAARTAKCVRFTAQPDSAYWEAYATENGYTNTVRSPAWFNPADRPAWTLAATEGLGAVNVPQLLQADASIAC
jgi:hypothetical protein